MNTARWPEIDRIIQAALDKPPDEREGFVDAESRGDTGLRDEVRSLLVRYENDSREIATVVGSISTLHNLNRQPELPAGHRLAKYQIISMVGRGGMGDVYLAEDRSLGRKVALKILSAEVCEATGLERPIAAEARTASALNHLNIVTVFDAGEQDGRLFIATEYVPGETLRQRLSRGPLELKEALSIAIQVTSALAAAHSAGVVHRDIKPENIMVRPDGVVKVLDFGIAKARASVAIPELRGGVERVTVNTAPAAVLGSLPYMSPEQARGRHIDRRSDIFSFGALLFELVTGTRAFRGSSNISTLLAVANYHPAVPRSVGLRPPLQRLIDHCLEKEPAGRPASIEEVRRSLENLRTDLEPEELKRRWVAAALAVVAVIAAIVLAKWFGPSAQQVNFIQKQLTHDGAYKESVLAFNGASIFFQKVDNWKRSAVQLSPDGNSQTEVSFPGGDVEGHFEIQDGIPGVSDVLFRKWSRTRYAFGTFAILQMPMGTMTEVPGVFGYSGSWSPDGKRIAFFSDDLDSSKPGGDVSSVLYVSTRQGQKTKVCDVVQSPKPSIRAIAWSQRNTLWFMQNERLFEVPASGSRPRPVFSSGNSAQGPGHWTRDGKHYFFSDIWTQNLWQLTRTGNPSEPRLDRITSGPIQYGSPMPTSDGGTLYAIGILRRGRLVRYDGSTHSWNPILSGISADGLDYSRDGKKVVFVSYPEGELWLSNADGTGGKQLTRAPMRAFLPHLSPDGQNVTFMARMPGGALHIYMCSIDGKNLRKLVEGGTTEALPSWSPDGTKVVYAPMPWDVLPSERRIFIYDVRSGKATAIPSSAGLGSPRWSPDGRFIACVRFQHYGMNPVVLLDVRSGQIIDLGASSVYHVWSRNSELLYILKKTPLNPAVVQSISMKAHSVQTIATFPGRTVANSPLPSQEFIWLGFDSDDSPLMLEDLGSREVYEIGSQP